MKKRFFFYLFSLFFSSFTFCGQEQQARIWSNATFKALCLELYSDSNEMGKAKCAFIRREKQRYDSAWKMVDELAQKFPRVIKKTIDPDIKQKNPDAFLIVPFPHCTSEDIDRLLKQINSVATKLGKETRQIQAK